MTRMSGSNCLWNLVASAASDLLIAACATLQIINPVEDEWSVFDGSGRLRDVFAA